MRVVRLPHDIHVHIQVIMHDVVSHAVMRSTATPAPPPGRRRNHSRRLANRLNQVRHGQLQIVIGIKLLPSNAANLVAYPFAPVPACV